MIRIFRVLTLAFLFSPAVFANEFVVELKSRPKNLIKFAEELKSEKVTPLSKLHRLFLVKRNMVERREYGLEQLRASPHVKIAEKNIVFKLAGVPNDDLYNKQWALKNLERIDLDIGAEQAWDITTGSDQVTVAIIDTGITADHEDLVENLWTNEKEARGKAGIDDDGNGLIDDVNGWDFYGDSADLEDLNGHGTLCAGIIGAKGNNAIGVAGVNWNVKLMPIRFAYSDHGGTLANALRAIEYAINNNGDIILAAWDSSDNSQLLLEMIERAQQKNILVIAAAGNDGYDTDITPVYPSSYDAENILSVASLDKFGALANYTNYGRRSVDVGAPGDNIASTSRWDYETSWDGGTSAAASYVAGIAALLKSQEPTITYFDLKDRIVLTARRVASLRGKLVSPGMANAYYALINQVAPPDTSDPNGWSVLEQTVETAHPYLNYDKSVFQIKVPNAKRFAVYFEQFETEEDYDYVTMMDSTGRVVARWSGTHSKEFSPAVIGDIMTIEFTSDSSGTDFGYLINKIHYEE